MYKILGGVIMVFDMCFKMYLKIHTEIGTEASAIWDCCRRSRAGRGRTQGEGRLVSLEAVTEETKGQFLRSSLFTPSACIYD